MNSTRNIVSGLTEQVEQAHKVLVKQEEALKASVDNLNNAFADESEARKAIAHDFSLFEKKALKLSSVDIEEILVIKNKNYSLRLALFIYGIVFEVLDIKEYDADCAGGSVEVMKKWYLSVVKSLRKSNEALLRIRGYSIDKVQSARNKELLLRARSYYNQLSTAYADDVANHQFNNSQTFNSEMFGMSGIPISSSRRGLLRRSNSRSSRSKSPKKGISPRRSVSPGKQLRQFSENSLEKTFDSQFRSTLNDSARSASPKKLQFATDLSIDTSSFSLYKDNNAGPNSQTGLRPGSDRVSAVNPTRTPHTSQKQDDFEWYNASDRAGQLDLSVYRPDSDAVHQLSRPSSVLSDAPLEDADWDPDAEQGGQWVKGEWVPAPNVTDKWWEKTPAERRYLQELRKRNTRDEEAKKAKERRKNSRVVYLSDAKIQEEVQKNTTLKKEIEDRQSDNYQQSLRKSLGLSLSRSGSLSRSATPKKSNSLIVISSPNTPQSMDRRSPNKATDNINREFIVASTPQAVSTINNFADTNWSDMFAQTGGSLQENVEEDDVEGSRFIGVILLQIAAIITYDEDSHKILALKTEVARLSVIREEEREKRDESLTAYQEKVEHRAKVEEELIATIKHVKFNKNKTRVFREKVRVARLMNRTSVNGHTLISWAAAHGSYDIVEDMLTHGATVGYTNQLLHLTATYLQLSYKIFIMSYTMRTKKKGNENENKYAIVDEQLRQDTQAGSVAFIAELEEAKAKRAKVLQNMRFQRSRHRFPVPEAVYAGKWEIVQRIYNRRLLHVHFMNSWIFPAPPPPFRRGFSHSYEHHKISIEYIMAQAINDLAAGAYLPEIGWIPPGDERDPYGEMQMELQKILDALAEKRNAFLAGRERIRALAKEKKNQTKGAEEMMKAIEQRDFRKCIFLAQRRGISIDTETANGYTPLLAAAEENVNMVNHEYMKNDDGRPCLAVEYLLDRSYYRPSINLETNKDSHTALMRACLYGRFHVLEALLDRGANINQVNRKGKTALHYAVEIGNEECVRILVERFADQTIQDANDKTAFKIAEELNFTGIMQLLSQFGSGFLGPIQVSRGRVNNTVRCPIGCGAELLPRQAGAHCLVCEWREVECTLGCGIKRLSAKELADHVKDSCVKRLITCKHCSVMCMYDEMPVHLTESCDFRIIPCPNRCGKNYQAYDMERHLMVCEHKTVECPQKCGKFMKMVECFDHVNTDCINRRVSCPLKCRGLIVYKLLQSHMETVCPFRLVQCRFCHEEMVKQVVEQHEKECDLRTRSCPWKCGEILPVKLFNEHKSSSCKHRFIDCLNGCNVKARVVDMDKHLKNECALRLIPCSLGCIVCNDVPESEREITQVVAKFHEYHIKYDCIERKSKCSLCLELVKAKDKDLHAAEQCQKRIVNCRTPGCLKSLPFDERLDHERFNCRFRQVLCAQGCGENITYLHAGIHMQRHCTKRIAPCPLNCGEKMPFLHIDEHLKYVCPRRYSKSSNVTDCTTSPADANSVNSSPHLMSMSNTDIVSVLSKQGSKLSLLRSLSQQSGLSINLDASVRYSRPASPANTVGTFGTFGTEEIVTDTTDK